MSYHERITDTIGRTPLVKLNRVTNRIAATVLAKLEYFNPAGSVKDRAALAMIEAAERDGTLCPGGTIVEATSGNTGLALAMIAAERGYRAVIVCTDNVCREKAAVLEAFGAEVVLVPSDAPLESSDHYLSTARRIADETPHAVFANQFFNPANPTAHYLTTGPEIWEQTAGRVTVLVAGAATGGTITGIARYLRERNPGIEVVMADPAGSIYRAYHETRRIVEAEPYLVEAVGQDAPFIPDAMEFDLVDRVATVSDKEAFAMARRLAREEGIFCGGSSGAIVSAALSVARNKTEHDVVVAMVPDGGERYLSRLFSDEWLDQKNLMPSQKR